MKASIRGLSLLASVVLSNATPFSHSAVEQAPLISSTNAKEIPNSYIVVFKKHVKHADAAKHHDWVHNLHLNTQEAKFELRKRSHIPTSDDIFEGLKHTYNVAGQLLGYSGHFDEDVIDEVRRHPDVEFVEKDSIVHTMETYQTEKNAPWGLARISHRDQLGLGSFDKYLYTADGGEGVDVYVIDTGTNIKHVDFDGRAHWGKTIPAGDNDVDGNGHGTHCSGTVAGTKYGVAKKANVYAVKVLRSNGSGTMSDVVKGVEWAAESHIENVEKKKKGFKGSAANMSLGGGKSQALDLAVNAAVDAGIHFAVAAGNDNADSCNYSPAAAEKAVTVGASTLADERAYFSNWGKCNDIFAPGLNIRSTWIGSDHAINTISGTSMASPHIAGLLAYFLSLQPAQDSAFAVAELSPAKLKATLMSIATEDALTDVPKNTKNILAWNGGGASNLTDIAHKGGYTVKRAGQEQHTFKKVVDTVKSDAQEFAAELERISKKIEHVVEEELEEFMSRHH